MDSGLRQNDDTRIPESQSRIPNSECRVPSAECRNPESSILNVNLNLNPEVINITINGERRSFERPLAFPQLIDELGLGGKRIAIERNGEIVPRSRFASCNIADGDKLEIVVAVGGG